MSEPETSLLKERWRWIETHRREIATALNQLSNGMTRQDRILLRRLARWFCGNKGYETAIRRPDVLAVCLPFIRGDMSEKPCQADLERAVRIGFCSIGGTNFNRGRLLRLFLYPAIILAAMAMLTVFFSGAIIPHFESVFDEFEIELPRLTVIVFQIARLVRGSWMIVFGCLVGLAGFVLLMNLLTSGRRNVAESWLDQQFKTTRNAAAGWAWHLAMLLDSGLARTSAIEIAGNAQNNHWLKSACQTWLRDQSASEVLDESARSPAFAQRFHLIHATLGLDNRAAQADLLKEIATYYTAHNRTIGAWWVRWLVSFLLWVLVAAIVLVVFALYGPMVSLISGLSGGF